jgi:DnaJ-domain-containing protein 1
MRYALLFLLLVASLLEYSAQGRFGIALVTGLYFFLLVQAEHAAKRFLKYGLLLPLPAAGPGPRSEPKKNKITVEDVLEVPRLGERRSDPRKAKQETPKSEPRKTEPKRESERKAEPQAPQPEKPKAPDFRGKPHEVLAVNQNAATQTIVRAFRRWVKEYHPDHARSAREARSANEHTRCLTDAKDKMLQKRKEMRKPRAA